MTRRKLQRLLTVVLEKFKPFSTISQSFEIAQESGEENPVLAAPPGGVGAKNLMVSVDPPMEAHAQKQAGQRQNTSRCGSNDAPGNQKPNTMKPATPFTNLVAHYEVQYGLSTKNATLLVLHDLVFEVHGWAS